MHHMIKNENPKLTQNPLVNIWKTVLHWASFSAMVLTFGHILYVMKIKLCKFPVPSFQWLTCTLY